MDTEDRMDKVMFYGFGNLYKDKYLSGKDKNGNYSAKGDAAGTPEVYKKFEQAF
jgi:hypothetical protein